MEFRYFFPTQSDSDSTLRESSTFTHINLRSDFQSANLLCLGLVSFEALASAAFIYDVCQMSDKFIKLACWIFFENLSH